jgi:hypothetical protein
MFPPERIGFCREVSYTLGAFAQEFDERYRPDL